MPEVPDRKDQVHDQIDLTNASCDRLNALVCQVGGRLSEVIRTPAPPDKGEGATAEEELVPVASSIRNIRNEIKRAISVLEDYLSRLEV